MRIVRPWRQASRRPLLFRREERAVPSPKGLCHQNKDLGNFQRTTCEEPKTRESSLKSMASRITGESRGSPSGATAPQGWSPTVNRREPGFQGRIGCAGFVQPSSASGQKGGQDAEARGVTPASTDRQTDKQSRQAQTDRHAQPSGCGRTYICHQFCFIAVSSKCHVNVSRPL